MRSFYAIGVRHVIDGTLGELGQRHFQRGDTTMTRCVVLAVSLGLACSLIAQDEKPAEFSGPQVGEKLTPFVAKTVLGGEAGKEHDLVKSAEGQAVLIVFVHEVNRPTV